MTGSEGGNVRLPKYRAALLICKDLRCPISVRVRVWVRVIYDVRVRCVCGGVWYDVPGRVQVGVQGARAGGWGMQERAHVPVRSTTHSPARAHLAPAHALALARPNHPHSHLTRTPTS
jgi:hypothetical protein